MPREDKVYRLCFTTRSPAGEPPRSVLWIRFQPQIFIRKQHSEVIARRRENNSLFYKTEPNCDHFVLAFDLKWQNVRKDFEKKRNMVYAFSSINFSVIGKI
jgi:hypothetical protein